MTDKISKAIDDVADTVKEGVHRTAAEGERAKRDVAGDTMTPGERAGSVINEAGDELKAGVERARRNVRDST